MIRKKDVKVEYEVAACDGCGRDLRQDCGGGIENVNCAVLCGNFGWPSPFEEVGGGPEYHLCEECWLRVLTLLGLPVEIGSDGRRYLPDGTVKDAEGNSVDVWNVAGALDRARALGPSKAEAR